MNFLGLDTTNKFLTVCVSRDGRPFLHTDNSPLRHSVSLMPAVKGILGENGLDGIDFLAVCIGPGSFTGIRIGVTTVKMLGYAKNIPCFPFTSFQLNAYIRKDSRVGVPLTIIVDGGNKVRFVQEFDFDGITALCPPYMTDEDALKKRIAAQTAPVHIVGNFADAPEGVSVTPCDITAEEMLRFLSERVDTAQFVDADAITPLYIQPSQAEKEYALRAISAEAAFHA